MEAESSQTQNTELPPLPVRQLAYEYDSPTGVDVYMPGPSWADLADEDPEMRLMGPPMHIPSHIDPDWVLPRRAARRPPSRVSVEPFLTTQNAFMLLSEDEPPRPQRVASVSALRPAPSTSSQESDHRSGPLSECSPFPADEAQPVPPSPRID